MSLSEMEKNLFCELRNKIETWLFSSRAIETNRLVCGSDCGTLSLINVSIKSNPDTFQSWTSNTIVTH